MDENKTYKGWWWLPKNNEESASEIIAGDVTFNPFGRIELELRGGFVNFKEWQKWTGAELIHGSTICGKYITLVDCKKGSASYQGGIGFAVSTMTAKSMYEGFHFFSKEEISFKSLKIEFSNFQEWLGKSIFKINHTPSEDGSEFIRSTLTIEYLISKELFKNSDYKVSFHLHNHSTPLVLNPERQEIIFKQKSFVEIEFLKSKFFSSNLDILYYVQNFLSLAVTRGVQILSLTGVIFDKEVKRNSPVQIFYSQRGKDSNPHAITKDEMLFRFEDIEDNSQVIFQRWLDNGETFQALYNTYFAILYTSSMYIEHKFLSLIQACESYLRIKFNNNGKFYLKEQLENLITKFQSILEPKLKNKTDFAKSVVDTRNYLSHLGTGKEKAATGYELINLNTQLRRILETCLLYEAGFDIGKIENLMQKR